MLGAREVVENLEIMDIRVFTLVRHTVNYQSMCQFYGDILGMAVVESWDRPGSRGTVFPQRARSPARPSRSSNCMGWGCLGSRLSTSCSPFSSMTRRLPTISCSEQVPKLLAVLRTPRGVTDHSASTIPTD